ncbi:hypothetical protein OF83DRAFT_615973 [Amylostereum chailletii]|nr:hypothetical protein OF83DRAFT_615973 [Amylostereum chailletii]
MHSAVTDRFKSFASQTTATMGSAPSIAQGPRSMPGDFLDVDGPPSDQDPSLPIFRIPPEILMLIFSLLPESPHDENDTWPDTPICLTVSQVCRYWRRIAHTCPELWSVLPLQTRAWTELALERSEPYPISFHAFPKSDKRWSNAAGTLALTRLPRARSVVIGHQSIADPNPVALSIKLLEQHPAPHLASLVVVYGVLGHKVFRGETPTRLRRLVAYNTWMARDTPVFRASLSILELHDCSVMDRRQSGLIDVLRSLPTLERLVLSKASESLLPRESDAPKLVSIVDCLTIPASATTLIDGLQLRNDTVFGHLDALVAAYTSAHPVACFSAFQTLSISELNTSLVESFSTPPRSFSFSFSDAPADAPNPHPALLSLSLDWPIGISVNGVIDLFLSKLQPFTSVVTAVIVDDHSSFFRTPTWLALIARLPLLSSLSATGQCTHDLARTCRVNPRILSKLTRLVVRRANLAETDPRESQSTFAHLLEALTQRSREPRMVLIVERCYVTQNMIRSFKTCLGEDGVEWDGVKTAPGGRIGYAR